MKEQIQTYKSEADLLAGMKDELPALRQGYDVSKALSALDGLKFTTAPAQRSHATLVYLYKGTQDFLAQLFADIQTQAWQGSAVEGRVTAGNMEGLTMALPFGSRFMKLEQVKPETLLTMAEDYCRKVSDSSDYYHRQELMAIFAYMHGLRQDPYRGQTQQLMREHRGFASRWLNVLQGGS
jgi:hypothetical protein